MHSTLGDQVGLRMGNGVIKGKKDPPICYATCGYMTRLMAHDQSFFAEHTHIIIDEVHERSIESDLLCLIVRRLMVEYQGIKLILMSATMNPDLFKRYFSSIQPEVQSIDVGKKPYRVDEKYLEDLLEFEQTTKAPNEISELIDIISKCKGNGEVRINTMTVIVIVINHLDTIVSPHFLPCHCCDYHGSSFLNYFQYPFNILFVSSIIIMIDIIIISMMIIVTRCLFSLLNTYCLSSNLRFILTHTAFYLSLRIYLSSSFFCQFIPLNYSSFFLCHRLFPPYFISRRE